AAPGRALAGSHAQPLAEPGFVGGEGDMAAGPAAQQAPVHVPQPSGLRHDPVTSARARGHPAAAVLSPGAVPAPGTTGGGAAPVAWACGEAPGAAVRPDRAGRADLGAEIRPGGRDGRRDLDHACAAAPAR